MENKDSKKEWILRMNKKLLQEFPAGCNPPAYPETAIMNEQNCAKDNVNYGHLIICEPSESHGVHGVNSVIINQAKTLAIHILQVNNTTMHVCASIDLECVEKNLQDELFENVLKRDYDNIKKISSLLQSIKNKILKSELCATLVTLTKNQYVRILFDNIGVSFLILWRPPV